MGLSPLLLLAVITALLGSWSVATGDGVPPAPPEIVLRVRATVLPTGPVRLELTVQNVAAGPRELALSGRPAYDFVVTTPDGREVWRWLHGQVVQDILQRRTLDPNAVLRFSTTWDRTDALGRRVAPGTYRVRGLLRLEDRRLESPPVTLTLRP